MEHSNRFEVLLNIDGEYKRTLTYSTLADIKLYKMVAAGDQDAIALKQILENPDDDDCNAALALLGGEPVSIIDRLFNRRGYMTLGGGVHYLKEGEFYIPVKK